MDKNTFQQYLVDEYLFLREIYPVDMVFGLWLKNLPAVDLIRHAEKWAAKEFKKPMNDALDALREGQAMQAESILAKGLGYEPRSEN